MIQRYSRNIHANKCLLLSMMTKKFWHLFFFVFLLGFPTSKTGGQQEGFAVSFTQRRPKESTLQFVRSQYPQWAVVKNQVIETDESGTGPPAIIAYYRKPYFYDVEESGTNLIGFVWIPKSNHSYQKIRIGKIPQEGGNPQISAIFFANADQNNTRELAVLVKWPQRRYDYEGAFYGTKIYDFDKDKSRFNFFKNLSNKFFGCECSFRDGRTKTAKYKMAARVRKKLQEMGS